MVSDPKALAEAAGEALRPLRFTVEDYHRLLEVGFLSENDRVELLDGVIYTVAPMGSRHIANITNLNRILVKAFEDKAVVSVQCPISLAPSSEPEPDFALLRLPQSSYVDKVPQAEDAYLLIEVADTTLSTDRTAKLSAYARADIPEVWILNVRAEQLEVYRDPDGELYSSKSTLSKGQKAAPAAFPDVELEWWL